MYASQSPRWIKRIDLLLRPVQFDVQNFEDNLEALKRSHARLWSQLSIKRRTDTADKRSELLFELETEFYEIWHFGVPAIALPFHGIFLAESSLVCLPQSFQ